MKLLTATPGDDEKSTSAALANLLRDTALAYTAPTLQDELDKAVEHRAYLNAHLAISEYES